MIDSKAVFREIAEWLLTFAGAFVLVMFLNTVVFAATTVRQSSMQDTLQEGQHLIVEKVGYYFKKPVRGDIVVFLENRSPENILDQARIFLTDVSEVFKPLEVKSNVRLVKRVIGVPGDELDISDGSVYVNGIKLEEPYIKGETFARDFTFPVKVPEGKYIVMGDNREVSKDSRSFGFIKRSQIEGKVVFRFWPVDKAGILR